MLRDLLTRFPLNYHSEWKVGTLDLTEQLLLTLMKLHLNVKKLHLSTDFNVSTATVTNVFITIVSALRDILFVGCMRTAIPSRAKNASCAPICFRDFPNCRMVIDCTEISVDRADNLKQRCTTYSHYKGTTAFEALIGVAP